MKKWMAGITFYGNDEWAWQGYVVASDSRTAKKLMSKLKDDLQRETDDKLGRIEITDPTETDEKAGISD